MPFGRKPDTSKKVDELPRSLSFTCPHTFLARVLYGDSTGSSLVCLLNPQQEAFVWDNMQEKLVDVAFQEKLGLEQKGQEKEALRMVLNDVKGGIGSRKLHIGGKLSAAGWEILNVLDGPNVDHVNDAVDLSRFADATFAEVHASHGMRNVEQSLSI